MTIGANDSVIIMDSTLDATAEVNVEKIWVDGGFGNRPDSITVQLYRDGTAEAVAELRGDDDTWAHTLTIFLCIRAINLERKANTPSKR